MRPLLSAVVFSLALLASHSFAGPCDSVMSPRQSSLKDSLSNYLHITQTFRVTLQNGLNARPFAAISQRLLDYGCWLIGYDTALTYNKLALSVAQRFRTLESDSLFTPDTTVLPAAGDSSSPVVIVGYLAMGCGHCREVIPDLYHAVTTGVLKGRARLFVRTAFPSLGERSLFAGQRCGRFWDYLLALASTNADFDKQESLVKIAKQAGLKTKEFKKALDDTLSAIQCKQSFEEAQRLGTHNTPAFFINGKRYTSIPSVPWIIDAVDYLVQTAPRRAKPAQAPGLRP
jgi:protein-disulfide isomerase